jgi:hypothetical protein
MFRLRRFYLDSIGVPDNRFSDLLVDLTNVAGEPTDSIVWLRNGAGKTTMLSLLLALILPDRRDFLATKTKKRTLEDLILGGDTAHVVAEWVDPAGQLLLTGAVYEWDNRTRPRDYNGAGKDRLRRSWWCVSPDPVVEMSTLDDLPFTLRSGGRYDRDRFRAHIRDLAAQGVNAVVADQTIAEWHSALRERRFDPELFHYFTEVNAAEGGIDGLFSGIDSPGAFVRYLLRFVGDKERVAPVRELLVETATEIAKRPVYLAEQDFCAQAKPIVIALGAAHTGVLDATSARADTRTRAAGYKHALHDAERIAHGHKEIAEQRATDLDAAMSTLRGTLDAARRRRDEYRRLAAEFRAKAAAAELRAAEQAVQEAQDEVDSWAAVDDHVRLAVAQAELDARKEVLASASEEARPLVEHLEAAKRVLAGALENEVRKAEVALAELRGALEEAKEGKRTARRTQENAVHQLAELDTESQVLRNSVERFAKDREALVGHGVLGADERVDVAEVRLGKELAAMGRKLERLGDQRRSLDRELETTEEHLVRDRAALAKTQEAHQTLAGELNRLHKRAVRLADNPRLRGLLQSDSIDLSRQAGEALAALAHAVADTDVKLIEVRARLTGDALAVRALTAERLLPPRPEVTRVIEALGEAGITAHSGWHYLAKNVPLDEHARYIAELPEVVDGVVVYGEPAAAVARLTEPVDDFVVVASATTFRDRRAPRVVLGPAAAQHDQHAADVELERRRDRETQGAERVKVLTRQREDDSALHATLRAFTEELPEDGLDGLRARAATAEARREAASRREKDVVDTLDRLRKQAMALGEEISARRNERARMQPVLSRLTSLAAEERDVVEPGKVRLAAIPGEQDRLRERKDEALARYEAADELIDRLRGQIQVLAERGKTWAGRREGLPRPATPTELHLDAAEAAVTEAETQLREQFHERELRLAVERSEKRVAEIARSWYGRPEPIQLRAARLAATPEGADQALRAEAADRAAKRGAQANQAVGSARHELSNAERELGSAPRGRLRATDDIEAPEDRDHALSLAAKADAEASEGQLEFNRLERDRDTSRAAARQAQNRAGMLRDQAEKLHEVEAAEQASGVVPDEDNETRAAVTRLVSELDGARAAEESAEKARAAQIEKLRRWASQDRFAAVAEDEHGQAVHRLREMFTGERVIERVAAHAGDLAEDLDMRERAIGQQLVQVQTHKNNVVVRLTDLVDDAIGLLGRASALSELPEGIGPWEHRHFLVVEARVRPSREQIGLRVGELVDRMVVGGRIELDAVELLWRATEASVVEGFRASVLKPAPDQPTGRTPVEEMRKWSGGENLTASLVLFCVMARLRAEQRSGAKAGSAGGVVPLDNPVGKANYLPFLDLQRRVARASGVQLVFWTGIGDLGAVTTFPRIAAMHKRPSTTRAGRAYVQVDHDNSQVVDVVTAVRREP